MNLETLRNQLTDIEKQMSASETDKKETVEEEKELSEKIAELQQEIDGIKKNLAPVTTKRQQLETQFSTLTKKKHDLEQSISREEARSK